MIPEPATRASKGETGGITTGMEGGLGWLLRTTITIANSIPPIASRGTRKVRIMEVHLHVSRC